MIKPCLTVFDNLPLEVIRTFILPHLNYEERIHLNRCLPAQDRFSRKMSPCSIAKHDQKVAVLIIHNRLEATDDYSGHKKYKNMIGMFKNLQTVRCFRLIIENPGFRDMTISKMNEMMGDLPRVDIPMDLNQRLKLASEIKKLRQKIEKNGPYGPRVAYDNVPPLSFQ